MAIVTVFQVASGGGGAGGRANGVRGADGASFGTVDPAGIHGGGAYGPDTPSTNGTLTAAGAQSSSSNVGPYGPDSGRGGAGGIFGQAGSPGTIAGGETSFVSSAAAGGAAGPAVVGGSNVSWYAFGSRLGSIDHPGTSFVPSTIVNGNSYEGDSQRFGVAIVTYTFASDGQTSITRTGTGFGSTPAWHSPAPTVIGTEYWIRVTLTNDFGGQGTVGGSMVIGAWNSLAISKSVTVSSGGDAEGTRSYSVEFSASNGGPVIATGTLLLNAVNTQF